MYLPLASLGANSSYTVSNSASFIVLLSAVICAAQRLSLGAKVGLMNNPFDVR